MYQRNRRDGRRFNAQAPGRVCEPRGSYCKDPRGSQTRPGAWGRWAWGSLLQEHLNLAVLLLVRDDLLVQLDILGPDLAERLAHRFVGGRFLGLRAVGHLDQVV